MRKTSLIALLLTFCGMGAWAYTPEELDSLSKERIVYFEFGVGYTPRQNNTHTLVPELNLGFQLSRRMSVFYRMDGMMAMDKTDGHQRYRWTNAMGGGVAFRMITGNRQKGWFSNGNSLDLRAYVTTSYAKGDQKFTAYNVTLVKYVFPFTRSFDGFTEVGYRYVDSHTAGIKNTNNFFVSLGMRF